MNEDENLPAQTFIASLWTTVNSTYIMHILKVLTLIVVASSACRTTAIAYAIQSETIHSL